MFVIGVTGEFGSGKTTVAAMFRKRGCRLIDADRIVHDLLAGHAGCRRRIRAAFGSRVVTPRGIDRKALAAVVFARPAALKRLEAIVHPLVKARVTAEMKYARERYMVLDAPLLIEAGWLDLLDVLVVVRAGRGIQVERIRKRMGFSRAEVMRRLRRQMTAREKAAHADFVINNRGSLADTDKQVEKIWKTLLRTTR